MGEAGDLRLAARTLVLGLAARGYVLAPLGLLTRRLRRRLGADEDALEDALSVVRSAGPWHFWTGLEPADGDALCFVDTCGELLPYLGYVWGGRYFVAGDVSDVYDNLIGAVYDVEREEGVEVAVRLCSHRYKVLTAYAHG